MDIEQQLTELRKPAQRWARSVIADFDLTPTDLQLVLEGARCLDIVEAAREEQRDTVTTAGRYKGTARTHPSITVERQARADFTAIVKQLALKEED